jgi:hypothetical protein
MGEDAIAVESELHSQTDLRAALEAATRLERGATFSMDVEEAGASTFRMLNPSVVTALITGGASILPSLIEALGTKGHCSGASIVRIESIAGELIEVPTSAPPDVVRSQMARIGQVRRISFLDF